MKHSKFYVRNPRNPLSLKFLYIISLLGNPLYREVYDMHGEEGLKKGVSTNWGFFHPYTYDGDCEKIYKSIFGTYSPYADIIDAVTNPPPLYCSVDGLLKKRTKDKEVEHILHVNLKEVFTGGIKKMKILRHEFIDDLEVDTKVVERWLTVPIQPGILSGTSIRFSNQGDQGPTRIPADIIFIIKLDEHPSFKRDGSNLLMEKTITLKESLCGCRFVFLTLDERKLSVNLTDIVG